MISLWPALGQTVLDHNGDVIPVNGISVTEALFTSFYASLKSQGLLLDYDPIGSGGVPNTLYSAGAVNDVATDAILATVEGDFNGQQAITSGATVTGAMDGGAWAWDEDYAGAADADHLKPGTTGAWVRNGGIGGTANQWFDVPLDETSFTEAGTLVSNNIPYFDATSGVWKTRPFPLADVPVFSIADYGAVGNGTNDDTSAIAACYAAAIDPTTRLPLGKVWWPKPSSHYRLSSTILIQNVTGLVTFSEGQGMGAVRWYGSAGQPMFKLDGANRCEFWGLLAGGRNSNNPSCAVEIIPRSSGSYPLTDANRFMYCEFATGGIAFGRVFDLAAGAGSHYAEHCTMSGYSSSMFRVYAGARMHFEGCQTSGTYVTNTCGAECLGGSYSANGYYSGWGSHGGTDGVDHKIVSNDQPITLFALNSEHSTRIMDVGDSATPSDDCYAPISLTGSRCDAGSSLASDGRQIRIFNATPVVLENNSHVNAAGGASLPPRIYMATTATDPCVGLGHNSWNNLGSSADYEEFRAASGVGTYYEGVLEYPNTWAMTPSVPVAHQLVYDVGTANYRVIRLPIQLKLVGYANGNAARVSKNFCGSYLVTGVVTQEVTVSLTNVENDTNFAFKPAIELISGAPTDPFSCYVKTKATGSVTLRFSQNLTGLVFRVNWQLERFA